MGAEREDTDLNPKRVGTEPGLGKHSGATPAAAAGHERPEVRVDDGPSDDPAPVDFDALHAALGDPLDYEDMSSGPAVDAGDEGDEGDGGDGAGDEGEPFEHDSATPVPAHGVARVGESSGRSSATYSSARPHTIPPTLLPVEDLNAPPVIVADDNATVPSAPPQMTVPLAATPHAAPYGAPGAPPAGGGQLQRGSNPMLVAQGPNAHGGHAPHGQPGQPGSGPHPAAGGPQGQGPHDAAGASPAHTPQPFPAMQRSGNPQMTMRMPERPLNPRRGKTPTVVVRPRGPSTKQKLVAFMAMLLLVTACGIAVIIWRKPKLLGLDPILGTPSAAPATPAPSTSGSGAGSGGATGATGATGANGAGTGALGGSAATTTPASPSAASSGAAAVSAGAASSAAKAKPMRVAPAAPPAPPATLH